MQSLSLVISRTAKLLTVTSALCFSAMSFSQATLPIVDDFEHETNNSLGIARQFLTDQMAGGKTEVKAQIEQGKMQLKGEIVPPRGQPGWSSSVFLLNPQGQAIDLTAYQGVKLVLKVTTGNISVSANSTEVNNFDYHAAVVPVANDGQFHEIRIPFQQMKRTWSEQTPLNQATINGLSIVTFAMQKASFDFELDEVSFY